MHAIQGGLGRGPRGFTFIELLVVLATVALILAILLPAMAMARRQAYTAACASNLRQTGVALAVYFHDNDKIIPGPNTSGYEAYRGQVLNRASQGADRPVMEGDWMSPLLGQRLGLSSDRNTRLLQIFDEEFRCPGNQFTYNGIFVGSTGNTIYDSLPGWPHPSAIRYNSYSSPIGFHAFDDKLTRTKYGRGYKLHGWSMTADELAVRTDPARYNFKVTQVGPPSRKVFAMDGARYVTTTGRVTFNIHDGQVKGDNWITRGPALNPFGLDNGSPYKMVSRSDPDLAPTAAAYTYRHPGRRINALFFDGHAEPLNNAESRDPNLYWPTGSEVVAASRVTGGLRNRDRIR